MADELPLHLRNTDPRSRPWPYGRPKNIYQHYRRCVREFRMLRDAYRVAYQAAADDHDGVLHAALVEIDDEKWSRLRGQLRVWAHNHGAHTQVTNDCLDAFLYERGEWVVVKEDLYCMYLLLRDAVLIVRGEDPSLAELRQTYQYFKASIDELYRLMNDIFDDEQGPDPGISSGPESEELAIEDLTELSLDDGEPEGMRDASRGPEADVVAVMKMVDENFPQAPPFAPPEGGRG